MKGIQIFFNHPFFVSMATAGVPGENDPEQATGKLYHLQL
jgi:hypothetical protein